MTPDKSPAYMSRPCYKSNKAAGGDSSSKSNPYVD